MKQLKRITLTVLALLGFINMSFADASVEKKYQSQQLEQRITRELRDMAFSDAQNEKGIVLVSFYINDDGGITVTESNYSDEKMYKKIKEKLESIRFSDACQLVGEEFNYAFKFKVVDER